MCVICNVFFFQPKRPKWLGSENCMLYFRYLIEFNQNIKLWNVSYCWDCIIRLSFHVQRSLVEQIKTDYFDTHKHSPHIHELCPNVWIFLGKKFDERFFCAENSGTAERWKKFTGNAVTGKAIHFPLFFACICVYFCIESI